jgi:hypothetical protein
MNKDESVVAECDIQNDLSWANDSENVASLAQLLPLHVAKDNPWSLAEQAATAAAVTVTTPTTTPTMSTKGNDTARSSSIPSIAATTPTLSSTERGNSTLLFSLPRFWSSKENETNTSVTTTTWTPLRGRHDRSLSTASTTAVSSSSATAPLFYNRYVNDNASSLLDDNVGNWSTRSDYNATIAAARAHTFRTRVYIGIYHALCIVDGILGLLLLVYAVALWAVPVSMSATRQRRHDERHPQERIVANTVAGIVSIWGVFLWFRALLILLVLSRSTRPRVPWYCFGTWRLATVLLSAGLDVCYGTATVWLLWDCSCHSDHHSNTAMYSLNDSWPESLETTLTRHCHAAATGSATYCQGGRWTAWLSTHQHELLLFHYWVPWLEQSLVWTMLGLAALESIRAVYAHCTLSFHFPQNDHNESTDAMTEPLLATTAMSWHEEVVPNSGGKQWWRKSRRQHDESTEVQDEDAHLFAAISEDWADRARDDPLWWSRE